MGRQGGGVLIAIKSEILSFYVPVATNLELLCVCLWLSYGKSLIIVCYRAPDDVSSFTNELHGVYCDLVHQFHNPIVFSFGDLNFPTIMWDTLSTTTSNSINEPYNFLDVFLT